MHTVGILLAQLLRGLLDLHLELNITTMQLIKQWWWWWWNLCL